VVRDFGFVEGSGESAYAWNAIGAMLTAMVNLN